MYTHYVIKALYSNKLTVKTVLCNIVMIAITISLSCLTSSGADSGIDASGINFHLTFLVYLLLPSDRI